MLVCIALSPISAVTATMFDVIWLDVRFFKLAVTFMSWQWSTQIAREYPRRWCFPDRPSACFLRLPVAAACLQFPKGVAPGSRVRATVWGSGFLDSALLGPTATPGSMDSLIGPSTHELPAEGLESSFCSGPVHKGSTANCQRRSEGSR